jgi:hypothetical protein
MHLDVAERLLHRQCEDVLCNQAVSVKAISWRIGSKSLAGIFRIHRDGYRCMMITHTMRRTNRVRKHLRLAVFCYADMSWRTSISQEYCWEASGASDDECTDGPQLTTIGL